jgi:hypothetical protein
MKSLIRTLSYHSWRNFKSEIFSDLYGSDDMFCQKLYIFRGQSCADWRIISSFDRFVERFGITEDRRNLEVELLDKFCENCKLCGVDLKDHNEEKIRALAQHNGLPTRLVDWSYSPYIAAFFAFASIVLSSDISDHVAIYALKLGDNIWNEESGISVHEKSDINNLHQLRQRGVFTLNKSAESSIEDYLKYMSGKGKNVSGALIKIILPSTEKICALADLDAMGITYTTLFSGIESCALSAVVSTMTSKVSANKAAV